MSDLEIRPGLVIRAHELAWMFSRSGGPGGQNVNKVETRVQLAFDLESSESFSAEQKQRIARTAGRRLGKDGVLRMTCARHRERERNRDELRDRLRRLVLDALAPRRKRVKTRPTRASMERRLGEKRRRSERKRGRSKPTPDD